MKKLVSTLALSSFSLALFAQTIQPAPPARKVQVAILFDTSNSMDGLIDQAKSRIWNIVNEVSSLRYNGSAPDIEFALYQYGNDGLSMSDNYIQQVMALSSDMDMLSEKLFGLRTNGGSEFCGAVIGRSLDDLVWSGSTTDLKMIYIAGNEPFNQGPVAYKEMCKKAANKNIFINTIYCGNYEQGVREFWQDGATCSKGDYFNIDSDREVVHIPTPYDDKINAYNDSLNQTYYGIGSYGAMKKAAQTTQDGNAEMQSVAVKAERSIVKSKGGKAYNNASWDMIDAVDSGKDINEISEEELPEEFKGKTEAEKKALIETKKADRERYQKTIGELAVERQTFIDDEMKKRNGTEEVDDFGTSVNQSILTKAKEIGFERESSEK
jgi:hypothetical protein